MAGKTPSKTQGGREDRLKATLKANMAKRKAQARARRLAQRDAPSEDEAGEDKRDG